MIGLVVVRRKSRVEDHLLIGVTRSVRRAVGFVLTAKYLAFAFRPYGRVETGKIVQEDVLNLLAARKGHFLLESGHHGELWLDLELLCLRPQLLGPMCAKLASCLSGHGVEVICGPLVEGAFVGLMVASELDVNFSYSERFAQGAQEGLFPAGYRIPDALQSSVRGKRVAIVNDVINAGSAVRGTFAHLQDCGATIVAIGALLVLGAAASQFALSKHVALETLASLPNPVWTPQTCPLCSSGAPLEDIGGFRAALRT